MDFPGVQGVQGVQGEERVKEKQEDHRGRIQNVFQTPKTDSRLHQVAAGEREEAVGQVISIIHMHAVILIFKDFTSAIDMTQCLKGEKCKTERAASWSHSFMLLLSGHQSGRSNGGDEMMKKGAVVLYTPPMPLCQ